MSNNKKKSKGNTKNGNKYLAWAFSEAAEYSRRHSDLARVSFNRKAAKTNKAVAYCALGHKHTFIFPARAVKTPTAPPVAQN